MIVPASNAFLYGKGVFTTVVIFGGEPFLWEKHWQRLKENASKLGIDISGIAENEVLEMIASERISDGRVRVTISDNSESKIWQKGAAKQLTSVSVLSGEFRLVSETFTAAISPFRVNSTSPLAGIKSCNYLENILAIDEARSRGFDEALRLNERGEITSGCMSNMFWLSDGKLFTPDLSTGCLAGTTRGFILENLECVETVADIGVLTNADDVFLTSAGIGIKAVKILDNKAFEKIEHPILELLPG